MPRRLPVLAAALTLLWAGSAAAAELDDPVDQWLPSSDTADWVYAWGNTTYSVPRKEHLTVQARSGNSFRLRWDEVDPPADQTPTAGIVDFQRTDAGLINLNYQSTPPPSNYPILCASSTNCGNSLAGTEFLLIWGTRSPTLAEPLLRGTRWSSLGGQSNDVASDNRYVGQTKVVVPAFPAGVVASQVDSTITQAGALGDPFGSGVRTVYWVRGVGPVRIIFRHTSGETSQAELQSTSLTPLPPPSDANYFPLTSGTKSTFRWRNSKHMRRWSTQRFTVSQVVNNSARIDVKSLSGPIKVAGSYAFSSRLSGVTNISAFTKAASRATFPKLGPSSAAVSDRRHLFTPYDFMTFGFNPVLSVAPVTGETWRSSRVGRDWKIFGVTGTTTALAPRKIKTPAGTFDAVGFRSSLTQARFPYGSGTRTSWFAAGKGLVKLVFKHRDGSVSTIERVG
ncbi:MAG: hypothetical protein ACJ762_19920 [Solirubrobacteraceae bacterium]